MHPVKLDAAYLREVMAASASYRVDSFEVCGDVHGSSGSMDGAITYRDYPGAAGRSGTSEADSTARHLREIVALAHRHNRPIVYWHREVMVPRSLVESVPGLLDKNGELDLLGLPYLNLVRSKLREFFDRVPNIDGLVLTLTESDYSVIHNSSPEVYPPRQVVAEILKVFAGELIPRGKRFILRSFGSIEQDYTDILAAAQEVSRLYPIEVETKITPYDFSPFLAYNPFLSHSGQATLSAEYDSIGEFLGAGYLPAADPARVIESVAFATANNVERHVIRVDRIGHPTFKSAQSINLLAFDRAINGGGAEADAIWREWSENHWPRCAAEMTSVMKTGIETVKKTHFIDGHVIFHAFPIHPEMRWIKACGILSLFQPGVSLAKHQGMWGILPSRTTPPREIVLREKDQAVSLADEGLHRVRDLKSRLSDSEYHLAETVWSNATVAARLIRHWCRCVAAYFKDMEEGRADHPSLDAAIAAARSDFADVIGLPSGGPPSRAASDPLRQHEYGDTDPLTEGIDHAYRKPLWTLIGLLVQEYDAEFGERSRWRSLPGLVDFVVCGGITDDHRTIRFMHASHARLIGSRPARAAGNRVFPNGFFECSLTLPPSGGRLLIAGDSRESSGFKLTVGGRKMDVKYGPDGIFQIQLDPNRTQEGKTTVRIEKSGATYPWIYGVATAAELV